MRERERFVRGEGEEERSCLSYLKVVTILLKAGANTRIVNKKGQTAADVAADYGKPHLAELLKSSLGKL